MISFKIEGLDKIVEALRAENFIEAKEIDAAVRKCAQPIINRLQAEYRQSFAQSYSGKKYEKTMALANSIDAFQRSRKKSNDPWFTYYIGPRWSTKETAIFGIGGGNAAYWMEYGTQQRFRANKAKGGVSIKRRVYGEKSSTGRIPGYGIIRRTADEMRGTASEQLVSLLVAYFLRRAKEKGLQAA